MADPTGQAESLPSYFSISITPILSVIKTYNDLYKQCYNEKFLTIIGRNCYLLDNACFKRCYME